MPDPRGTSDPGMGNRATARRATHGSEAIIRDIADQITGRGEPDPPEPDSSGQFFEDLVAVQGNELLSPARAREIRGRGYLDPKNVEDPEATAAALLGFDVLLTVASFYPPLGLATDVGFFLLAIAKGRKGEIITAGGWLALGVIGRFAKLERLLSKLVKPGLRKLPMPKTIAKWREIARELLDKTPKLKRVAESIKDVTREEHLKMIEKAYKTYKTAIKGGKTHQRAAQLAGNHLHKLFNAAKSGADFVDGKLITELKSNWSVFFDERAIAKANDQVLAYVLKDFVENGTRRRGFVWHVFIHPETGKAVGVVVDSLDGLSLAKMLDSVL
jgi:hypothetical protein